METSGQLQRIDQLPQVAIAIKQTFLILLECGPGFSVLSASRISLKSDNGAIHLEDCTQMRIEKDGRCYRRDFEKVTVFKDPASGYWIATPDKLRTLFLQPSLDPYAIVHLSGREARSFDLMKREDDFESAFSFWTQHFGRLPGFYSPEPTRFCAPENYAEGKNTFSTPGRFI